ncbi:MAG: 3-hydroxybutyrate dehydrogenase [Alphaproteobacteria bacterium]|nr:3-hydroxybutyrate dehydrogenase [Alphaproteobacteria bacterium]
MLTSKTALVTGSTSGIGLAIASALAGSGANVMLNGFGDASEIETIRKNLERAHGIRAGYNGADLTKPEQIDELIDACFETFDGIDILINNAGIQHTAAIEDFPPEKWDAILALNLSAAFHTIHRAVPHMRERGWGRIINTASVHGLVASKEKAAYVAAKHGLIGLSKVVALETAGAGITCNAICPGWTLSELIQPQIDARAEAFGGDIEAGGRDLLKEKQPSQQFVTTDQIGALVVFLCSEAAAQITGVALPIDGGWTAQ